LKARVITHLASIVVVISLVSPVSAGVVRTKLVSRYQGVDAVHGESSTFGSPISGNGRFVLFSVNDDGLPGTDATRDIYLRDRLKSRTRLATKTSTGEPVEGQSSDAMALSQNGRFVAFSVEADNLPGGPDTADVYLRNLRTGKTRLVSKTSDGDILDGDSDDPSVSANGKFVAFQSSADNLPGDDAYKDVYVHNRRTGKTKLVSKTSASVPANGDSDWPSLSADGSRVSFQSQADNLPGPDGLVDVFVHNLSTGNTRLVSKTSSGEHLDASSEASAGSMNASGRFVTFGSSATNLPGGGNAVGDVYLHSLLSGKTRLISKTSGGTPGDDESGIGSVSGGGRFVVFESDADNLPGTAGVEDVFLHDRRTRQTRLLSQSTSGNPGNDDSFYVAISADGRFVAFSSRANNFSADDDNAYLNVFVRGPLR
jgi:Tol biopolymer transport system component